MSGSVTARNLILFSVRIVRVRAVVVAVVAAVVVVVEIGLLPYGGVATDASGSGGNVNFIRE